MAPKLPPSLRPLLLNKVHNPKTPLLPPQISSSISKLTPSFSQTNPSLFSPKNPLFFSSRAFSSSPSSCKIPFIFPSRAFSSSPSSSNIVLIGSEQGFNTALSKVQDEKLPAIFYFTAVWCGPCRMLSPLIEEMSKTYPHVTTYKIDIDQEGLGIVLSKLNISSVPTLHFFQDGKRAAEMVGADAPRLKSTMEILYMKE